MKIVFVIGDMFMYVYELILLDVVLIEIFFWIIKWYFKIIKVYI